MNCYMVLAFPCETEGKGKPVSVGKAQRGKVGSVAGLVRKREHER